MKSSTAVLLLCLSLCLSCHCFLLGTSVLRRAPPLVKTDKMDDPSQQDQNTSRQGLVLKKTTMAGVALLGLAGAALASVFWPFVQSPIVTPPWPLYERRWAGRSLDARSQRMGDAEDTLVGSGVEEGNGTDSETLSVAALTRCLSRLREFDARCQDAFLCRALKDKTYGDCPCPSLIRRAFRDNSESRGVSNLLLPFTAAWSNYQTDTCSNCSRNTEEIIRRKKIQDWNDCL